MNILLQRKNFMVYTQKFWSLISKTHPPPHICQMYADSSRFKIFDFSYHFTSSNWYRLFVDTYFTVWLHRDCDDHIGQKATSTCLQSILWLLSRKSHQLCNSLVIIQKYELAVVLLCTAVCIQLYCLKLYC